MTLGWMTASVADCLVPVPTGGKAKVQARDYKPVGRYPVIDQGQDQIAGWTDDENAVITSPLPLIIFGDHTRAFKFADRPFARGADGTQVLRPRTEIDPLFFFFACRAIDLPARGYSRHFTILKEKQLQYPADLREQVAIAATLRHVESTLAHQQSLQRVAQDIKRATMRELFTRGLRGEPQKDTEIGLIPASWSTSSVGDALTPMRFDRSRQIQRSGYRVAGRWPIIDQSQLPIAGYTDDADKVLTCMQPVIVFGDHTRAFKYIDFPFALGADGTKPLLPRKDFDARFLFHALTGLDVPSRGYNRHYSVLSQMQLPHPSLEEQCDMASVLDAIDRKVDLHRRKRKVLEELFKALLHKLMTGEIQVTDLNLSALTSTHSVT